MDIYGFVAKVFDKDWKDELKNIFDVIWDFYCSYSQRGTFFKWVKLKGLRKGGV